ncbi:D-lactate dehydrogenase [Sphingomonas nostoxanthinifaciens]|uniref:D-lactate dehydrogenase n=1 Tax=Sphingomonas nostoxanthinifaciens TaxID=2872652 RepID=UPI001CC21E8D|nr:D-lactate dehydrogenase [Sphingomonas nostoxanthinifaciens]UAK24768.1 D-lactate dehydrogenase [Sphingomonas nostoxanthinifaciens]
MSHEHLVEGLRAIVGRTHVLTAPGATRRFRHGYRSGAGAAVAVVRPGSLIELWRAMQACVAADVSIIMQASNTGLTGGSTPDGDDYPGGMVIVSTTRLTGLHLIDDARQVVCLPGTTLYDLERALAPQGREPHSVIGSSCIGASVMGGICNNSGGALVQRGPAFSQLALYARVTAEGRLDLVNHLGIRIDGDAETVLAAVEAGRFDAAAIEHDPAKWAHDHDYAAHVRAIDSPGAARFNADPRCLFEGSGSAGKLILFAVRLDTFPKEIGTRTFYIGTNDPAELTALRRGLLGGNAPLPIAGEYMHRDCFDITAVYGKDTFVAIQRLGTDRLPRLFAAKARVDAIARALRFVKPGFSDRLLQWASTRLPRHLPPRMTDYRHRFEHHLMLKVSAGGIEPTRALLDGMFPSETGAYFECSDDEATKAFLHRFAAAGAAVRYRAIHADTVEDIVALDIALPRNTRDWVETLPPELDAKIAHKLYYGHFLCHVFHQDYVVRKGHDPLAIEHAMWALLDARGAEYPAEHNVGHLYKAKPALADFYRGLDPRNQLNPGIGQTTKARDWADA